MVCYCCAFGCKEKFQKGGSITFHSFPKNPERRRLWEIKTRRKNFKATQHTRICSKHFTDDSFDREKFGGTWLKDDAVPTLFDFPSHLSPVDKHRKSPLKRHISVHLPCSPAPVTSPISQDNEQLPLNTSSTSEESISKKKLRYVGDFDENDTDSPTKARLSLAISKNKIKINKLRNLRMKSSPLLKRIATYKDILIDLKRKSLITETASQILERCMPGAPGEIIQRMLKGSLGETYPPALRAFALTLNFYSSEAYNYVRKVFQTSLPHPSTLRTWYKTVDGSPGFTQEALNALAIKCRESSNQQKKLLCGLIVDEMAIKKHVEWNGKKFCGYVDLGTGLDDDDLPVAKEAFVFLLTCLNGNWKIPIGYFLVNGLEAKERANLIKEALRFVSTSGIEVVSLTFDGASTNISTARCLGANLSSDNMDTSFPHPVTKRPVFVVLDACHMLKLVRNTLASKGVIIDANGGVINWKFIEDLENFQKVEGLMAANKLRKSHIQWYRQKMKVKLAAQTLSGSVADALEYLCKEIKIPAFVDCMATVKFIRTFNNLFDVLNSRNLLGRGYKSPMKAENEDHFFKCFHESELYIKGLQCSKDGPKLLLSNRKTGFLGFLVCIKSFSQLFSIYVKDSTWPLNFLLTYKLSQDHLEQFFSVIRSKGGWNNNPTARQMESAYTRVMVHTEVTGSAFSNCCSQTENLKILCASGAARVENNYLNSINHTQLRQMSDAAVVNDNVSHDHSYSAVLAVNLRSLNCYVSDVVMYIAGFVQRKISKNILCSQCRLAVEESHVMDCVLVKQKNRGGLVKPTQDVVALCRIGEQSFRSFQAMGYLRKRNAMAAMLVNSLGKVEEWVFSILNEHILEQTPMENHRILLIKSIFIEYFNIRFFHNARCTTDELQDSKVRSIYNKMTLFKGH